MSDIQPNNPTLLTDDDVEYANFNCCGDQDLIFLRCPACGHISVQCYECETWFINLADVRDRQSSFLSDESERLKCSHCHRPFEDFHHLMDGIVDKYLPTAEQVIDAGHGRHLASRLREKYGITP